MNNIPEKINMFNVYSKGEKLIGLSGEITLPSFEALTETISGPGILGEIDSPTIGQFSSMELEIPFRVLDDDIFSIMPPLSAVDLTLRASQQYTNGDGSANFKGIRIVARGRLKSFTAGTLKQGSQTESSIKIELNYILIVLDGKTKIELDKLNCVYKVDEIDILEKVRNLI